MKKVATIADLPNRFRDIGDRLSVTLVGPEYPVNVGHTARLLKNFGIRRLYLIEPKFDRRIAGVYASHADDLIENAETLDLGHVRKLHDLLVATTAIRATRKSNVNRFVVTPEEVAKYVMASSSVSLVFGRDTTGLTNEELEACDIATTIDTGTGYRTLNVTHSVAIMLYLMSRGKVMRRALPSKETRETFSRYAYALSQVSGLQEQRAERVGKLAGKMILRSQLSNRELLFLASLMRRAVIKIAGDSQQRSKT